MSEGIPSIPFGTARVGRRRRILCACGGVPAWDDATPWAYTLHELLGAGFDAALVHLLTEAEVSFFRHRFGSDFDDPHRLGGLHRHVIEEPSAQRQPALADLIDALAPELLLAWGFAAARLLRRAAPKLPLVLMVSRCERLEQLIDAGAVRDFPRFRGGVERGIEYPCPDDDAGLEAI